MQPGRLRKQLSIQRQVTTVDAVGQLVDTWNLLVTRMAAVEPLNGREYFNASGENSNVSTRIRMRYDATVGSAKPYDRIVDQSVSPQIEYDIESVINPNERNTEVIFMCRRL